MRVGKHLNCDDRAWRADLGTTYSIEDQLRQDQQSSGGNGGNETAP
jgi:hypothetical protein